MDSKGQPATVTSSTYSVDPTISPNKGNTALCSEGSCPDHKVQSIELSCFIIDPYLPVSDHIPGTEQTKTYLKLAKGKISSLLRIFRVFKRRLRFGHYIHNYEVRVNLPNLLSNQTSEDAVVQAILRSHATLEYYTAYIQLYKDIVSRGDYNHLLANEIQVINSYSRYYKHSGLPSLLYKLCQGYGGGNMCQRCNEDPHILYMVGSPGSVQNDITDTTTALQTNNNFITQGSAIISSKVSEIKAQSVQELSGHPRHPAHYRHKHMATRTGSSESHDSQIKGVSQETPSRGIPHKDTRISRGNPSRDLSFFAQRMTSRNILRLSVRCLLDLIYRDYIHVYEVILGIKRQRRQTRRKRRRN